MCEGLICGPDHKGCCGPPAYTHTMYRALSLSMTSYKGTQNRGLNSRQTMRMFHTLTAKISPPKDLRVGTRLADEKTARRRRLLDVATTAAGGRRSPSVFRSLCLCCLFLFLNFCAEPSDKVRLPKVSPMLSELPLASYPPSRWLSMHLCDTAQIWEIHSTCTVTYTRARPASHNQRLHASKNLRQVHCNWRLRLW